MYLSDATRSWLSPNVTQSWPAALKPLAGGNEIAVCWGIRLQGAAAERGSSLEYCMVGTCSEERRDLILPPNVAIFSNGL